MSVEAIVHQSHTGRALDKGYSFVASTTYSTAPLGARLLLREALCDCFLYTSDSVMDRANRGTVVSKLAVVTILHQ